MRVAGVILAGGKGSRIGGGKPLLPFGEGVLIDAVIGRAAPQVELLALNVPYTEEEVYRARYGARFDLVTDPFEQGAGPLAGIVGGLLWARDVDAAWLATFPCDAPFLPRNLVARLMAARVGEQPCAAEDASGFQGVCAVWPVACADR
ncbi:MAG TPA: NTP transferase domain-containing protein, partial [Rhizomicrobium sp.]|nr:NTP transferase domain-containing protein [Rhizomicrobium sp.]